MSTCGGLHKICGQETILIYKMDFDNLDIGHYSLNVPVY
jgi:hypothetical protein